MMALLAEDVSCESSSSAKLGSPGGAGATRLENLPAATVEVTPDARSELSPSVGPKGLAVELDVWCTDIPSSILPAFTDDEPLVSERFLSFCGKGGASSPRKATGGGAYVVVAVLTVAKDARDCCFLGPAEPFAASNAALSLARRASSRFLFPPVTLDR